jgi:hypothetical protein
VLNVEYKQKVPSSNVLMQTYLRCCGTCLKVLLAGPFHPRHRRMHEFPFHSFEDIIKVVDFNDVFYVTYIFCVP